VIDSIVLEFLPCLPPLEVYSLGFRLLVYTPDVPWVVMPSKAPSHFCISLSFFLFSGKIIIHPNVFIHLLEKFFQSWRDFPGKVLSCGPGCSPLIMAFVTFSFETIGA
jgi:hypothetical protein